MRNAADLIDNDETLSHSHVNSGHHNKSSFNELDFTDTN